MSDLEALKKQLAALDAELAEPDPEVEERALRKSIDARLEEKAWRAIASIGDKLLARGGWERPGGFTIGSGADKRAIWFRQLTAGEVKTIAEANIKGVAEYEMARRTITIAAILAFYPHDTPMPDAKDAARWTETWIDSRSVAYPTLWDELFDRITKHTTAANETLRGKA